MAYLRIIAILVVTFAANAASAVVGETFVVDSLYIKGARGMVPCNDGSFVGGYINCPTFPPGYFISDKCDRPMLTRSWDGGRTWAAEEVAASTYAYSGIVRLREGLLLTAHNSYLYGFMSSTDDGRSWSANFDTTRAAPVMGVGDVIGMLFRDHRGLLFWKLGGGLHVSLDNGQTFVYLPDSDVRSGYYVLAPDGLIVTHAVQAGESPGTIQMSFDHGRSWSQTLTGYDRKDRPRVDSASELTGCVVIRDTVAVADYFGVFPDGGLIYVPQHRTLYWHRDQRQWKRGRHLSSFGLSGVMDSTDCWHDGYTVLAVNDTVPRPVSRDIPADSIPRAGDTLIYSHGRLDGVFYDLDGNVHPHGTDVYIPRRAPRPVSRLDRLYTCTGVEYVVGGHRLDTVMLDAVNSENAVLSYTITPNRRLSTIVIEAADPALPMRCKFIVDDSITGRQWFTDSVMITSTPTVEIGHYNMNTVLMCTYPEGPFMWYYNDTLLPHPLIGVNGDSMIVKPKPGTYKVKARSRFGCDVWSNEVAVTSTDVNEFDDSAATPYVAYRDDDGSISVRWTANELQPSAITVYDMLGRRLDAEVLIGGNNATLRLRERHVVVFLMITAGTLVNTHSVVCLP